MIKVNFVGDFFAYNPQSIKVDSNLEKILKDGDVCICNFEGPVSSIASPVAKSGPSISQSKDSIPFLRKLGVNLFTLGNNHTMDFGKMGLIATTDCFNRDEMLGAGPEGEAYKVVVKKINGKKIGFISASHYEFGMISSENSDGVAWINDSRIDRIIIESRPKVDFLFILPHAGVENIDIPLPQWRKRYKSFIDIGVDGVIATHPHVPQGREFYKNKPIYYSLGNFFFERMNDKDPRHHHSILVQIEITDEGIINVNDRVVQRNVYDLNIMNSREGKDYLSGLNAILEDDNLYRNVYDKEAKRLWNKIYKHQLNYSLRKLSLKYGLIYNLKILAKSILGKKDNLLLLNCFQCESHRWVIEYVLNH